MKKKKVKAVPVREKKENKVIEYLDRKKAVSSIKEYAENMRETDDEFKRIVHELHQCKTEYQESIESARGVLAEIKDMRDEIFGR